MIENPKWTGIFAIALTVFGGAVAQAQQAKKIPRIGYLVSGNRPFESAREEAFRQGLRELGYMEGQNIIIEYRYAEERFDRLPGLASELIRLSVEVVVAAGNQAITAAKQASTTQPIVMATSGDPIRQGFVESLARPGGNVTGLTLQSPELSGKRLELLMEVIPKLSLVAVLLKSGNPLHEFVWKETQDTARALKVNLQSVEVRDREELDGAFSTMRRGRAGALIVPLEPMFNNQRARIVDLAQKNRLPAIFAERQRLTANEVRVNDQFENREANRPNDSAQRAGASGSGDSVRREACARDGWNQ